MQMQNGQILVEQRVPGTVVLRTRDGVVKRHPTRGWEDLVRQNKPVPLYYSVDAVVEVDGVLFNATLNVDAPRNEAGQVAMLGIERLGETGLPTYHPVHDFGADPEVVIENGVPRYLCRAKPLADGTPVPPECLDVIVEWDKTKTIAIDCPIIGPKYAKIKGQGVGEIVTVLACAGSRSSNPGRQYVKLTAEEGSLRVVDAVDARPSALGGFAPAMGTSASAKVPEKDRALVAAKFAQADEDKLSVRELRARAAQQR